ncbi:hypothetical protein AB0C07_23205 [Actinoplanes missouriensis]|uniref:hypothetical protein n=1 Tax=Actinoplanes missouriensis TaxID=1866 RepID=UPI0033C7F909
MRRVCGTLLALCFIGRAVAEPFLIDVGDPASYRGDWGGPSLAGVLLAHCGPGVVAAVLLAVAARGWWRAWWRARLAAEADRSRPYRRRTPTRARPVRGAGASGSAGSAGSASGSAGIAPGSAGIAPLGSAARRSPHQPR